MPQKYLAVFCLGLVGLSGAPAQAAMSPTTPAKAPVIVRAAAQCGLGYHRDPSGFCVDSMDYSRACPPTYFPVQFPNGNGYRCAPTEWLASSGWLGGLLQPWGRGLPQ